MTYRIGRHARSELSITLRVRPVALRHERPSRAEHAEVLGQLDRVELPHEDVDTISGRLAEQRSAYEPHARALARQLVLDLPKWYPPEPSAKWNGGFWKPHQPEPRA